MAVETNGKGNENFGNIWKHSSEEAKLEHKLRCRLSAENDIKTFNMDLMDTTKKENDKNFPTSTVSTISYSTRT